MGGQRLSSLCGGLPMSHTHFVSRIVLPVSQCHNRAVLLQIIHQTHRIHHIPCRDQMRLKFLILHFRKLWNPANLPDFQAVYGNPKRSPNLARKASQRSTGPFVNSPFALRTASLICSANLTFSCNSSIVVSPVNPSISIIVHRGGTPCRYSWIFTNTSPA